MKFLSKENEGSFYAIISGLLYGLIGYYGVTLLEEGMSISSMVFWRFSLAAIILWIFLFFKKEEFTGSAKNIITLFINSIIFYGISSVLYFMAAEYIGTGLSMVIFFTYPAIIVAINLLIFKQKINRIYYVSIGAIFLGMILLIDLYELSIDFAGIVLSLITAFLYAIFMITTKTNKLSPAISTLVICSGCAFGALMWALIEGSFSYPNNSYAIFILLSSSLLSTLFPTLLLIKSLKYISAEKASLLSVLEPVFTTLFGIILLNETISAKESIGTFIILIGSIIALFSKPEE